MIRNHDPVATTAVYMERSVEIEKDWDTTLQKAREALQQINPRELYREFIIDLKNQIEQNSSTSELLASLLHRVVIRGFGMSKKHVTIKPPNESEARWRVNLDEEAVKQHLDAHIVGEYFLNPITLDETIWDRRVPIIGASDVSQHQSAVPFPGRFFKRHAPFVLNNAAGILRMVQDGREKFDKIFNPRPDEELLRWMLIDPSYQDELEREDYERCLTSAMDVGQYKFDLNFLLKANRRQPNIIFRDGSLFPQDAYLHNFAETDNQRGDFTREAILELLNCLIFSQAIKVIYCGVSKKVELNVYSAVVDWYIAKHVDPNWHFGNYVLSDGQAMSMLLASPSFVGGNLEQTVTTCLIRRSFTTRANLNLRADLDNLDTYFSNYQKQYPEVDIARYQKLCEIAHIYMFFIGHSKNPQQQLPRYEFFYTDSLGKPQEIVQKILSSLQTCGLMIDRDHSFMAVEPIRYLIPTVTQVAHDLSKQAGKQIATEIGQKITARFRRKAR